MNKEEILKTVHSILLDILELKRQDLSEPISTDTVENWDSLAHLMIINQLSASFDIDIPVHSAVLLTSEALIVNYVVSNSNSN